VAGCGCVAVGAWGRAVWPHTRVFLGVGCVGGSQKHVVTVGVGVCSFLGAGFASALLGLCGVGGGLCRRQAVPGLV